MSTETSVDVNYNSKSDFSIHQVPRKVFEELVKKYNFKEREGRNYATIRVGGNEIKIFKRDKAFEK
jgi:hypothetical protein